MGYFARKPWMRAVAFVVITAPFIMVSYQNCGSTVNFKKNGSNDQASSGGGDTPPPPSDTYKGSELRFYGALSPSNPRVVVSSQKHIGMYHEVNGFVTYVELDGGNGTKEGDIFVTSFDAKLMPKKIFGKGFWPLVHPEDQAILVGSQDGISILDFDGQGGVVIPAEDSPGAGSSSVIPATMTGELNYDWIRIGLKSGIRQTSAFTYLCKHASAVCFYAVSSPRVGDGPTFMKSGLLASLGEKNPIISQPIAREASGDESHVSISDLSLKILFIVDDPTASGEPHHLFVGAQADIVDGVIKSSYVGKQVLDGIKDFVLLIEMPITFHNFRDLGGYIATDIEVPERFFKDSLVPKKTSRFSVVFQPSVIPYGVDENYKHHNVVWTSSPDLQDPSKASRLGAMIPTSTYVSYIEGDKEVMAVGDTNPKTSQIAYEVEIARSFSESGPQVTYFDSGLGVLVGVDKQ